MNPVDPSTHTHSLTQCHVHAYNYIQIDVNGAGENLLFIEDRCVHMHNYDA
jgi:hypothetical protein